MQKKYLTLLTCLNVAGIFSGNICFGQSPAPNPEPHVTVYKTRKDYSKNVPVILSADKKEIVSYPDPADVVSGMAPVKLKGNYWLDRRGINGDVAFLKLTYAQYAALKKAPTDAELKGMILDANPLKELCDCGPKSALKQPEQQLNTWITSGKLRKHCKIVRK